MVVKKNRFLCVILSLTLMAESTLQAAEPFTLAKNSRSTLVTRLKEAFNKAKTRCHT